MAKTRLQWGVLLLIVTIFALFWVRMEFATSVTPMSYDAYLTMRNVNSIQETGRPLTNDPLSLTGRTRVGSPLYPYILATAVTVGEFMYKVLPNLFMVLLLIPIYYLAYSFTKSMAAGIFSVLLAGTAPSVLSSYLNSPTAAPLAIGIFLTILVMLQNPNKYLYWIIALTLLLTFLSPIIFILVLALLMVIFLLRMEGFGVDMRINELFFFTLLLAVWFNILVYKRALFTEGVRVLWQNLPAKYVALQFGAVTYLDLIYGLGVVTFLFGVFGTYYTLFETRMKVSYTVVAAELAVLGMMLARVIELKLGLLVLSLLLAIMAGYGLVTAAEYVRKTKFPMLVYPLGILTLILFIVTALLPGVAQAQEALQNAPSEADVQTFRTLGVSRGAIFLTTVREGAAFQYYSGHTTVTDDDFLMLRNGEELVRDIDGVYNARFAVSIPSKAEKLGFTHILFSEDAQHQYGRSTILIEDHGCIRPKTVESSTVYRVLCRGEQ